MIWLHTHPNIPIRFWVVHENVSGYESAVSRSAARVNTIIRYASMKRVLSVIWSLVLIQTVTVILYCSSPSTSALNQWELAIRSQLIHIIVLYAYVHSSHVALVGFSDFLHHLLLCSCTSLDGARHCDGPLWVVQGQVLETGPDRGRNMRTTVLTL